MQAVSSRVIFHPVSGRQRSHRAVKILAESNASRIVAPDFAMWGIAQHHAIASRHPLFPVDRFGGRVVKHD
jgi:hypothetical protein